MIMYTADSMCQAPKLPNWTYRIFVPETLIKNVMASYPQWSQTSKLVKETNNDDLSNVYSINGTC